MVVQTLKLGSKKFVVVPEKDYRDLKAKAGAVRSARKARRLTTQDGGDIAEAKRRLADPNEKPIPYQQVRKELGLA